MRFVVISPRSTCIDAIILVRDYIERLDASDLCMDNKAFMSPSSIDLHEVWLSNNSRGSRGADDSNLKGQQSQRTLTL